MNYLNKINSPQDLKKIPEAELTAFSEEIRQTLIERISKTGGHLGSNLGMVEATVAMHYVFDSPKDKIVFDVSHQCYTHKILTGRKDGFIDPDRYDAYSGFSNPLESEHDLFLVGHTATSVSLATGLAKARDLKGENYDVIAVIGDGSLSGGEAFEGLNNAAMLDSNIIILFNDNQMSISPNYGGMYRNFELLRETKGKAECNFFKSMGFDYFYVDDGNDVRKMIETLRRVKGTNRPTVVHINTLKGKGLEWCEKDKENSHYGMKAEVVEQIFANSYAGLTTDYLLEKMQKDPTVIVIDPATPGVHGFTPDVRKKAGKQFTDVGIAEEHAVAYASGLAKNGAKPVLMISSSFIQRTYDQLMQDLALNHSPATILVFSSGLGPGDATHSGAFDIAMMESIPGLVCLAPTTKEEYFAMLDWSIEQTSYPVIIRVPGTVISGEAPVRFSDGDIGKYQITEKGNRVAILGLGGFLTLAEQTKAMLKQKTGIEATVINPRTYSSVDKDTLESLKESHDVVVTLEDGVLDGGFGQRIAGYYGVSDIKVLNFGGQKEFNDRVPMDVQQQKYHLTPELIAADIEAIL